MAFVDEDGGGLHNPVRGLDVAFAERLLSVAMSSGGDHADLYFEYRSTADFTYEEGRVRSVGRGITMGLGVRVVSGDATGYAYTEELCDAHMLLAARTAAKIASSGASPGPVRLMPGAARAHGHAGERAAFESGGLAKLDLLARADRAARAVDARIVRVQVTLAQEWREILIITSDGECVSDRQPMTRLGVHATADSGGQRQAGRSGGAVRGGIEQLAGRTQTPEDHGAEAARAAVAMLHAVEAPAGPMEVVLAPGDSGILLHEAVGHGLEADFIRKRHSNYTDRVGQVVASPLCTVVDDATVAEARGSIDVDDEGNLGRRKVLIENGVLLGYMHDRISSRLFKTPVTGNGRRQSFRHEPRPRMTNTLLCAGTEAPEDIISSVRFGVYAKRFSGGQVNISNGDFVFGLTESYLIEDGKITAPLKGVNLIGNGPEVLRRVSMVGADFRFSWGIWTCGKDGQSVPVGLGTPTVKISEITVGGTQR